MTTEKRRRREPWPVILAAALCAMIGASVGFYRVAADHPDPLVVQDAYAAGRAYSERVRAERHAEALGWHIELEAEPEPGRAEVWVALRDGTGARLAADRVVVRRERPAEGGLDADVPLAPGPEGWAGAVELPRPGRWYLVVRAERGADAAERTFALFAP